MWKLRIQLRFLGPFVMKRALKNGKLVNTRDGKHADGNCWSTHFFKRKTVGIKNKETYAIVRSFFGGILRKRFVGECFKRGLKKKITSSVTVFPSWVRVFFWRELKPSMFIIYGASAEAGLRPRCFSDTTAHSVILSPVKSDPLIPFKSR